MTQRICCISFPRVRIDAMRTPTRKLFPLGHVVMTRGIAHLLKETYGNNSRVLWPYLNRHQAGDWSEMDADDQQANAHAIGRHIRIFAAYTFNGVKIWIITEADRSATTILFPQEY